MVDRRQLKSFAFFSELSDAQLSEVAHFSRIIDLEPSERVYRPGDTAADLYGVIEGTVELSLMFTDKRLVSEIAYEDRNTSHTEFHHTPIVIAQAVAGNVFGWSALSRNARRTVQADAIDHTRMVAIPSDRLQEFFDREPAAGYRVMNRLSDLLTQHLQMRTDTLVQAWGEAFGVDRISIDT